ncbi:MAG: ketoacyl-ACP synthase III, partial [Acidobacteriota bacterium]|nr:ketoacyl-ACP synthase III [Acidobacteriota bacterium]
AGAIDMAGACAGFLYAVTLASSYLQTLGKPVLVIGANVLTRRVRPDDPATVSLFSDGAGAVLLVPADTPHVLGSHLGSDGSRYEGFVIPAGGSRESLTAHGLADGRQFMTMQCGKGLFRHAIQMMVDAGDEALQNAALTASAIDWWIPHQANLRIIEEAGRQLKIPRERTVVVIDRYANSSAATIPIAWDHAVCSGQIQRGQTLLLTAVGAGMLNAGLVLRW